LGRTYRPDGRYLFHPTAQGRRFSEAVFYKKTYIISGKTCGVYPVCRVRFKSPEKDKCEECRKRYESRVKEFLPDSRKTIWIDEVADKFKFRQADLTGEARHHPVKDRAGCFPPGGRCCCAADGRR